jgi:hypothetical protein
MCQKRLYYVEQQIIYRTYSFYEPEVNIIG